jgi:hypothetical protein
MDDCDHIGHFRVTGSPYLIIRWCDYCGKAWRLPTQGDYIGASMATFPAAEWEEIRESREEWINTDD